MKWQKVQSGFLNADKIYFIELSQISAKTNPFKVTYYLSPQIHRDVAIVDFFVNEEAAMAEINKLIGT